MVWGSYFGVVETFRTRPYWPRGSPSLLYNGYRVSFSGVKRPDRGVDYSRPSNAEAVVSVELYFYLPSVPAWRVI